MREIKFSQLSDLHLGIRFTGGRLALPPECAAERRRELRRAVERFIEVSLDEEVDLVLLPGDLFDSAEPAAEDVDFLIGQINRLRPTPVILAPGNHDAYSRTSIYNRRSALYAERPSASPRWGDHVDIFTEPAFVVLEHESVRVVGCGYRHDTPLAGGPLANIPPPDRSDPSRLNLLFFHGALQLPGLGDAEERGCNPFTARMLAEAGYDYAAVGHYHAPRVIRSDGGRLLGAYAGAPLALAADQTGERGFLIGRLRGSGDSGGPALASDDDLRFIPTDPRQMRPVEVPVTGVASREALEQKAAQALAAIPDEDMVCLTFVGRHAPGLPPQAPSSALERFFHAVVENRAVADHEVPFGRPPSPEPGRDTVSQFRNRMMARWEETDSPPERRLIEEATRYGLDALTRREVTLR